MTDKFNTLDGKGQLDDVYKLDKKSNVLVNGKTKAGFDPNQPRNPDGKWGSGSGFSDKLLKLSELPKAPPHKTDKHGRIIEGKVHLYHSTNGLENLNDIVTNGINLDKQTAVQGLFFAKLGSPYRKHDSFVVLEMDVNDVPWGQRFMDSEVAFGRIENYEIVHSSTLSPENLRTIKSLHKIFEKRGFDGLEKALDSYDKYEGEGNEVSKAVRGLISEEKKSAVFVKAGFKEDQARDESGKWTTDRWGAMRKKEQEIKDLKKERAVIVNRDGEVIQEINGSDKHVDIDWLSADAYWLTHNHPNNSSLSRNDIGFLLSNGHMNGIRAIGPNGTVYEMTLKESVGFYNRYIGMDPIKNQRRSAAAELYAYSWGRAQHLAENEMKNYLIENYSDDPQFFLNWRFKDQKRIEATKHIGRFSDRVNWFLANETELGKKLLKYRVYESK